MARIVDCDHDCNECLRRNKAGIMSCEGEDNRLTLSIHTMSQGGIVKDELGIIDGEQLIKKVLTAINRAGMENIPTQITVEPVQRRRF